MQRKVCFNSICVCTVNSFMSSVTSANIVQGLTTFSFSFQKKLGTRHTEHMQGGVFNMDIQSSKTGTWWHKGALLKHHLVQLIHVTANLYIG